MQVKDVMTRGAEVVRPDATLQEAASKMKSLDIGPLPVCDGDKIIGMLTDRDITVRATAKGLDPKQTRVREVMSKELITCLEDQDVKEAAELMQSKVFQTPHFRCISSYTKATSKKQTGCTRRSPSFLKTGR